MKKNMILVMVAAFFIPVALTAQSIPKLELRERVREYRMAHEHEIINELIALLSIPNNASDRENIRRNAELIKQMLEKRGVTAGIMETGGAPLVYGELNVPGAALTLMFYAHYDGQAVDRSKWIDSDPFKPALRPGKLEPGSTSPKPIPFPKPGERFQDDWRIYARSASDDTSPIVALLTAMDAVRSIGVPFSSNLKFIFEGEEEASSPNLKSFAESHSDLFKADVLYVCDGPVYYSNQPTLKFGARGIVTVSVTVYGPNTNVHSGHYGNWAPNPAFKLARLIASMKDVDGIVLVDGFYDTVTPLSAREREALNAIPPYDEEIKELYGFSGTEGAGKTLMELINLPSLNIRGLQSAWVGGQARTVIPAEATAAVDIRLVKGNDPADMVEKVRKHIEKQGFHVVSEDPGQKTRMQYPDIVKFTGGGGYPASRTPMDLPIALKTIEALTGFYEEDPVLIPTSGGSVPLYIFTQYMDLPTISVPTVNHDNNQHQPNENIRIGHFWTAVETMAALLVLVQ